METDIKNLPVDQRYPDVWLAIAMIEDREATTPDRVSEIDGLISLIGRLHKSLKAAFTDQLFLRLSPDGQITVANGDGTFKRYYIGTTIEVTELNAQNTLASLLETVGVEAVARCLCSNPWKTGQVQTELEAVGQSSLFSDLFAKTKKTDVATGKPLKGVCTIDERFVSRK